MRKYNLQGPHRALCIALSVLLLLNATIGLAECDGLSSEIDALSTGADVSERHIANLDSLFEGQIVDGVPHTDLVNVPLDLEKPIELAVNKISSEIDALREAIKIPQQYEACGPAIKQWLSQKTRAVENQKLLLTKQLELLHKPRSVRLVLLRVLNAWQEVNNVRQQLALQQSAEQNKEQRAEPTPCCLLNGSRTAATLDYRVSNGIGELATTTIRH